MLWVVLLSLSIFVGYEFSRLILSEHVSQLVCVSIGIPIGYVFLSWISYFLLSGKPMTLTNGLIVITIFLVIYIILYILNFKKEKIKTFLTVPGILTISASFFIISYIMYISMHNFNDDFRSCVYPDIGLHHSIMMSFIVGTNQNRSTLHLNHTLVSNKSLSYPFIPDYHASVLVGCGKASLKDSLLWSSYPLLFSFSVSLYFLASELTDPIIAVVSVYIFLNLGGFGFFGYENNSKEDWVHRAGHYEMEMFHPVMHVLIAQRSSLYSLPMVIWAIYLLQRGVFSNSRMLFMAGVLVGFLPNIQAHAYLGMAIYSLLYCIFNTRPGVFWKAIGMMSIYGLPSIGLAIPQVFPLLSHAMEKKSFMGFSRTWKLLGFSSPITMWTMSLGLFFVISVTFSWIFTNNRQILSYIPSLVILCICTFVRFQPWVLDNVKILYAGFFPIAAPLVAQFLVQIVRKPRKIITRILSIYFFASVIILMTLSSFLCYVWAFKEFSHPTDQSKIDESLWIIENTPNDAVFVGSMSSESAASLAGRQSFLMSEAIAASHGFQISSVTLDSLLDFWSDHDQYVQNEVNYVSYNNFLPDEKDLFWLLAFEDDNLKIFERNLYFNSSFNI